jgi:thymidylate synthase (FAD)
MEVAVEEATENPEMVVIRAARNDYKSGWVGDQTQTETLAETVDDEFISMLNGEIQIEKGDVHKKEFLQHLLNRGHFGPYEHINITFMVKGVSRSLMAQLTRHRTGISFDIQSQRYVDFAGVPANTLVVTPKSITDVRSGNRNPDSKDIATILDENGLQSETELEEARKRIFSNSIENSVASYNRLRDLGVAPEDARYALPIGSKVNIYFTLNARTLLHIADMRAAADAQWEIREFTEEILELTKEWIPNTMEYYMEEMIHRKNRLAP